jgi:cytochrome b561
MMVFMEKYGKLYRTFKHGAFHGVLAGIFFAMPITGIVALYERRSAKYIFVHVGYWTLTMALMGGVICAYA